MIDRKDRIANVANLIGISESNLYRKLSGSIEFKISEMKSICEVLNFSQEEINDIFLS